MEVRARVTDAIPYLLNLHAGKSLRQGGMRIFCHDIVGQMWYGRRLEKQVEDMSARPKRTVRSAKLDLRLTLETKRTLQLAAEADRKSVTDFVIESALLRAEERLADRRHFHLDARAWAEFQKLLDAPPREHPRLKRLLQEPGFFDRGADR
jgi:uncharacterized protein (DUF1778 family)